MKTRLSTGPGLVMGIPTLGRPIPLDWAFAFKSLTTPINFNCIIQVIRDKEVAVARNEIAKVAIEKDAKYLFFLGDDVVPPPFTLKQLIFRLENNPEIGVVGGVYVSKTTPSSPLVFRGNGQGCYWDWKIGEFFPVTGMGMDCTLIRVEVFKQLQTKGITEFFKTVDKDQFLDGNNNAEAWTEDLFFFDLMEKHLPDSKIYVDGGIICHHWDVYGNRSYTIPPGTLPMRELMIPRGSKKLLIVGSPLPINDDEKGDFKIVTFGNYEGADYRGTSDQLPFDNDSFEWVIVNDPGMIVQFIEWERILKPGGKLSILYSPLINRDMVKQLDKRLQDEPNGMLVLYKEPTNE